MQSYGPIDALPLWGFFVAVLLLVLLSVEGGYRLGQYRRGQSAGEVEAPLGSMVGATLGLLAFMLAFTFGSAAERYDSRRQVLLDEANAIGTSYLRAGMLPERREEVRKLLRDYVDTRLQAVESKRIAEGIVRSEKLQEQLWAQAVTLGERHPTSIVVGLFVQSLNEVIDVHAKRVTVGVRNRIPGAIWLALLAVAVLALAAMGYHAGLAGPNRSLAQVAVALTFSVVIALIGDLDRPQEGTLIVSQQALVDLRQSMQGSRPP
jgi:hypothetical protein